MAKQVKRFCPAVFEAPTLGVHCVVAVGSHDLVRDDRGHSELGLGVPVHRSADGTHWTRYGLWTGRVSRSSASIEVPEG